MSSYTLCCVLITEFLLGSFLVVDSQSISTTPRVTTSVGVTPSTDKNVTTVASGSTASAFGSGNSSSATHSDFLSPRSTTTATNQSTVISTSISSTSLLNNNVTSSDAGIHGSSTTAANPSSSNSSSTTSLVSSTTRRLVSSPDFTGTTIFTVPANSSRNDTSVTANTSAASPNATSFSSTHSTVNINATAASSGLQSTTSSAPNTSSSTVAETESSTTHIALETSSSSAAATPVSTSHQAENTTTPDSPTTDGPASTTYSASSRTATTGSATKSADATSTAGHYMTTHAAGSLAWVAAPVIFGVVVIVAIVLIVLLVLRRRQKKRKPTSLERHQKQQRGNSGIMNPSFRIDTEDNERPPPAPISIEDFINHVAELHRDSDYGFASEFSALNKMSPQNSKSAAEMPENRTKNRFTNVLPFDHSRVKLIPADDDENGGSDYINASFLPGFSSRREFIAAQGPMKSTIDDFWRMIWEYNVTTIVMVTNLFERGREKCVQYWPEQHEPVYYGDIQVEQRSESSLNYYTIRVFSVTLEKQSRRIMHYQFQTWPDFGVPKEHSHLLSFLTQVRSSLHPSSNHPVLIHCSAGVGRTGTFILVDHVLQLIRRNSSIDLFGLVLDMRNYRPHMIQTEAQYIFAHECVKYAIELGYHQGRDIFTGSDDTSTGDTEGELVYMNSGQGNN